MTITRDGSAGSPANAVQTVQGITGMTPLTIVGSAAAGVPVQNVAGQQLITAAWQYDGFGNRIKGVTITGGSYQGGVNKNEATTILLIASAALQLGASGGSQTYAVDYPVNNISALAVDWNVTAVAGTGPTLQVIIERKGADGIYYPIYTSTASGAIQKNSQTIGLGGQTNAILGALMRVTLVIAGTATPTITFSMSIQGSSL